MIPDFEGMLGFINDLLPQNEHIGQAFWNVDNFLVRGGIYSWK